ncbi:MAG: Ig-like domain-containing protein [Acidobacteriota bacterium]
MMSGIRLNFLNKNRSLVILGLMLFTLMTSVYTLRSTAQEVAPQAFVHVDLATTTAGVTVLGANDNDKISGNGTPDTFTTLPRSQPLVSGDFNGDGKLDIAIGAPETDYTPLTSPPSPNRANTGAVYIIFGRDGFTTATTFDANLLSLTQPDIQIYGAVSEDHVGFALATGDINGDGRIDLLIGAPGVDAPGMTARADSGATYIMLGAADLMPKTIDLSVANAINIVIYGERAGDQFGTSVAAGDVGGGNTTTDIIVGAPLNKGAADDRTDGGAAYVIFGGTDLTPNPTTSTRVIDLGIVSANVKIFGNAGSKLGSTVAVGDLNATPPGDIVVGAINANRPAPGALDDTGAVFSVFGGSGLNPPVGQQFRTIDIAAAQQNLSVYGADGGDLLGASVAVGDVTGDGIADLVIGAPDGDGPTETRSNSGEAYLIKGATTLDATRIDVSPLTVDLTIYGAAVDDHLGSHVAVGRLNTPLNMDGVAELIAGAPGAQNNRGQVSAFYGGDSLTVVSTRDVSLGQEDYRVSGAANGDELGWSFAATDLDNNGGGDLAIGAPFADVTGGLGRTNAGKVYVILASIADVPPVNNPPTVQVTSPNGGQTLQGGNPFNIAWTATDPNGDNTIMKFEIRLSTDSGNTFNTLITSDVAGDARSFSWNVPTGLNTTTARIQVIVTDNTSLTGQDASDADFTITDVGILITLNTPNGGEQLKFGQTYPITWSVPAVTAAQVKGFDLFLSTDGGTNFNVPIAFNPLTPAIAADVRTFEWTVPSTCSTTARVLVIATSLTGARSSDSSNTNLSITGFGPTVATDGLFLDETASRMILLTTAPTGGTEIVFTADSVIEISSDEAGTAFFTFSKPFKLKKQGKKVVSKGVINNQELGAFFPNGATRVLKLTNPPCGISVLKIRRQGDVFVIVPLAAAEESPQD